MGFKRQHFKPLPRSYKKQQARLVNERQANGKIEMIFIFFVFIAFTFNGRIWYVLIRQAEGE
jgi:hypothetical protein